MYGVRCLYDVLMSVVQFHIIQTSHIYHPTSNITSYIVPLTSYICTMSYRIGFGIDFHQLKKGRDLWIGGVKIPFEKGALGHSDADVLLHAICDAILGAMALGDIGLHFPNNSEEFKDIDSKILLKRTVDMMRSKGYSVVNIDASVCLEEPKLRPYIVEMQQVIAGIVGKKVEDVSVKATTTEKLGFIGKGKGIAAYATVLLEVLR